MKTLTGSVFVWWHTGDWRLCTDNLGSNLKTSPFCCSLTSDPARTNWLLLHYKSRQAGSLWRLVSHGGSNLLFYIFKQAKQAVLDTFAFEPLSIVTISFFKVHSGVLLEWKNQMTRLCALSFPPNPPGLPFLFYCLSHTGGTRLYRHSPHFSDFKLPLSYPPPQPPYHICALQCELVIWRFALGLVNNPVIIPDFKCLN